MGPGRYADPQDLARNKKRKCTDADAQVVHVRDTGLVKPDARSAVAVTLAKGVRRWPRWTAGRRKDAEHADDAVEAEAD